MSPPKLELDALIQEDTERKQKKVKTRSEITFREYLGLLGEDPQIAQNASSRHLENIRAKGVEPIPEHEQWLGAKYDYKLFSETLYGVDHVTGKIVDYIEAGKNRGSLGKQILIMVGPPGTGKSTFASILVRTLEESVRPVYAIKGCPKHEEPLHLLPRYMREKVSEELGVRIEGDLCPICRAVLEEEYAGEGGEVRWWDVPVVPFTFSKQGARGISSFEPSDEKSSDVTALTGRENISITSKHGYGHPRAYELSGAIPKAERGICEGRELTSSDPEVLGVFFSVAEERELKITGSSFPHISVDTLIIGHTNLTPYKTFAGNKKYEGLHQRFFVVLFPYPTRVKDELKVYKKLIERESDLTTLQKCHIAPGALELAATFAVLTRLVPPQKGVGLLTKAKIYNGDMLLTDLEDKDTRPRDIYELIEEGQAPDDIGKKEGMFGATPRDVLSALNTALVEEARGSKCLTPLTAIRALRDGWQNRMGYSPEQISGFLSLLSAEEEEGVIKEFRNWVLEMVSRAFLKSHQDLARELFEKYIREVEFYCRTHFKFFSDARKSIERDPVTGKPREPDLKFMKSVEQHIPWTEKEAETGRGELLQGKAVNKDFSFETYTLLRKAVERKLLSDTKDSLTLVLSQDRIKGDEATKRVDDLFSSLKDNGCCEVCAKELVEKAREFLSE